MTNKNVTISEAGYSDLESIRKLVVSLAVFEKEPDAVLCTLEEYQQSYSNQDIFIYKAELDGKIVGMALYYYIFSTWKGKSLYLEDFIVDEKYRSLGIGKSLFTKVVDKAKSEGCRQMKWQVLDWNKGAVKFYEKAGANIDKTWWNGHFQF